MEIKDLQKREGKIVSISIRTYPSYSKWLKEKNISPNALFDLAIKELMDKEK